MSAKKKSQRPVPEVDEVTPELESLLAQFTDEEIETGVITRPADAPAPTKQYDPDALRKRLGTASCEESLARLLRAARTDMNRSLTDVANSVGKTRSWISQIEKEGSNLQISTLKSYADALDCDVQVSFVPRDEDKKTVSAPLN